MNPTNPREPTNAPPSTDSRSGSSGHLPKGKPTTRTYGPRPPAEFSLVEPDASRGDMPQLRHGLPGHFAKLRLLGSLVKSYTRPSTLVMLVDNQHEQDEVNTKLADVHGVMKATGIRGSGTGGEFYTLPRRLGKMFTCSPTSVETVSGTYATQSLAELLSKPLPTMGPATLTLSDTPERGPRVAVLSVGSQTHAANLVKLVRRLYKPHTLFSSHAPDDSDSLAFTILVELCHEEIDAIAPELRQDEGYTASIKMQEAWVAAEIEAAAEERRARAEAEMLAAERAARIEALLADVERDDESESSSDTSASEPA